MKKILKNTFFILTYAFAAAGVFFLGTFTLNRLNLTNVSGNVDHKSQLIKATIDDSSAPEIPKLNPGDNPNISEIQSDINKLYSLKVFKMKNFCRIQALNQIAGDNAKDIVNTYRQNGSDALVSRMIGAAVLKLSNDQDAINDLSRCDNISKEQVVTDLSSDNLNNTNGANLYPWTQDDTWPTLSAALTKDKDIIDQVAAETGVESRMIIASTFAEQTRMFRTQRGLFKKYLQPLNVLASANQFSLGVMGIKQKTAEEIEQHLTDSTSPYYLGPQYEHLLDFSTNDPTSERYKRLSNDKDHYYSYLYGALFIKQIEKQWADAGYPIEDHPEIVATLFNIGFQHSDPNPNAQVGGATININGENYTFGALAYEFYYSGKLTDSFPYTFPNTNKK